MAQTLKVLGQSALAATTLTAVYTVPAATTAAVSTITVCERSGAATTYRLSVAVAGAADATSQYLVYDAALAANETQTLTLGISLGAGDVVRAYAGAATVSVNVFGVENS